MVKYEHKEGWFNLNDIELPEGTIILERSMKLEDKIYIWYLAPKEEQL